MASMRRSRNASVSPSARSTWKSWRRRASSATSSEHASRNPMTYYGGKELAAAFRTVRKNTIQIAEEIPEEKYGFRATSGTRTIGETLAHIAVSTGYQHH